jgi:hypothetical protein
MTPLTKEELLAQYRRMLDSIHANGNIYYDVGRMQGYCLIALRASNERKGETQ